MSKSEPPAAGAASAMQSPAPENGQARYPGYPATEEPNQILELWKLFWLNKWSILGLTLVGGVIALLYANSRIPLYRTSSTVLIEPRINRPVPTQEVYDPGVGSSSYFTTQLAIVRSREIVGKIVDRLDLASHPEFNGTAAPEPSLLQVLADFTHLSEWLPIFSTPEPATAATFEQLAQQREAVISQAVAQLYTESIPNSLLMRIGFVSRDAALATRVANVAAEAYIEYGLESRLNATQMASKWLAEKLGEVRGKLEQAEKNMQTYRDRQQLVNVGGVRTLAEEELMDNARRLRDAQKKKTDLATVYWKIQQAGNDVQKMEEINELFGLALVSSAKAGVIGARETLKQLQHRYGDKHPTIAAAETRLQTAQRTLQEQLLQAVTNIRTEFEIARETERVLTQNMEIKKDLIRQMDRKDYDFRVLQREVDTNRQLYDLFLVRFKETDTSHRYDTINARLVDPAVHPGIPFAPNRPKILRVGIFIGLALGLVLAVLRKMLEQTVRSIDEMETLTGVPVLSVTPLVLGSLRRKNLAAKFIEDPRTPFAEGIRSIRTGIQLSDVDRQFKRILITSAMPGEGKSSVAAALAIAFAASERVLLLDADLRLPSTRKMFDQDKKTPGLIEFLTGENQLEDCLMHEKTSGIHTLSVRKAPPNPTEVINSASFGKLLLAMTTRFDRIIVDSPPVLVASDALILSRITDAVVFIVRADVTHRHAVKSAVKQMQNAQARLIGAVINAVDISRNSYYGDSHYYAHKYYGTASTS